MKQKKQFSLIVVLLSIISVVLLACTGDEDSPSDDPDYNSKPAMPTNLTIDVLTGASVKIQWTDKSNNELGFKLQRSTDDTFLSPYLEIIDKNNVSFIDRDLSDGSSDVSYYYRIAAYNNSPEDLQWTGSVRSDLLAQPTNFHESAKTSSSVTLDWTNNSALQSGLILQRSTINDFSKEYSGYITEIDITGTSEQYIDDDSSLQPNTTYYYRLRAEDDHGCSKWTDTVQVDLESSITINPPTSLQVKAGTLTETEVTLQWEDNSTNNTGFIIDRAKDINFTQELTSTTINSADTEEQPITGLESGTSYYFRIRAILDDGTTVTPSTWSTPATQVTTESSGDPTATLSFTTNKSGIVYVAWIEDTAGNYLQTLYICKRLVIDGFSGSTRLHDVYEGVHNLTGLPLPYFYTQLGWDKNNDSETTWAIPHECFDGVSGASSMSTSGINETRTLNIGTVTQFKVCFEIDKSSNDNIYFPDDRPSFIYKTDIIDLNNLNSPYNLNLVGWMSNSTTGGFGQQPATDINGDYIYQYFTDNFEQYKFMDDTSYINTDGGTDSNGNEYDFFVQSLSVVISK